jgi:hypothetical protein
VAVLTKCDLGIESDPEMIEMWIEILRLNNVRELLSWLSFIVETITGGNWWSNRGATHARLP